MEITWYGQTCFRLSEQSLAAVVTDPYPPEIGLTLPHLRADIVTASYDDPRTRYLSGVGGSFKLIDGPGDYEIGGVFVTGVITFADDEQGASQGLNNVFAFHYDGLSICHLGRLGHVPTQSQVERLGTVNVLLLPVGGGGSLTAARASEVISLLEPGIVVPMDYQIPGLTADLDPLDGFLKEMGVEKAVPEASLQVSRSSLTGETEVVVLQSQGMTTC